MNRIFVFSDYVQTLGRPVGSYYGHGLFQQFKRKDGQLYNVGICPFRLCPGSSLCVASSIKRRSFDNCLNFVGLNYLALSEF